MFVRERAAGSYSTGAYFAAKTLFELLPMRALPPLLLGATAYWLIGLQMVATRFAVFEGVLLLVTVVTTLQAMCIGAVAPSVSAANVVAVLALLVQLLFGGFLISNRNVPVYLWPLQYASVFNYATEVLLVNELRDLVVLFDPVNFKPLPLNGAQVLLNFGFDVERFAGDVGALCAMCVVLLVACYALLRWGVRGAR